MSMKTYSLGAVLVLCLCATSWGSLHVSGEVFGIWPAGDSVYVEGGVIVPKDKGLYIGPGAVILVKTTDPFIVAGDFEAAGTAEDPIIVDPLAGWEGFIFRPSTSAQILSFVVIPETSPDPLDVVTATDANMFVDHCDFHALRSCLNITGGWLHANWNLFRTSAIHSKTVRITQMGGDPLNPCSEPLYGNQFHDNIVKADVAPADTCDDSAFTSALYISGSSNICLTRNTFSVLAPGFVIGAYFGNAPMVGGELSILDSSDVTARSHNCVSWGVFNAIYGQLRVLHCNIDVGVVDHALPFRAAAVLASQQAGVQINSSNVVVDRDTFFFVAISGAALVVDYLTYWSSTAQDLDGYPLPPEGGIQEMLGIEDPLMSVEWGEHCNNADPMFLRQGAWGQWRSFEAVAAYYGLDSLSPSIDAGDVQWGYDPDNTLPDIGRYYYAQPNDVSDDGKGIATAIALAPAYPNPFNSATTIPFALDRSANVRLVAFDITGREVKSVFPGLLNPGQHRIVFDASGFASGIYFVQVEVEGAFAARQKVVFLK